MLTPIIENLGTIAITLLLIIVVSCIILTIIRDKKQGRSTCGGNCAHCNACAGCRPKK